MVVRLPRGHFSLQTEELGVNPQWEARRSSDPCNAPQSGEV